MSKILFLAIMFIVESCYISTPLKDDDDLIEFDPHKKYVIVLSSKKQLIAKNLFREGRFYHYFTGNQEKIIPVNDVEELLEREFFFAGTAVVITVVAVIFYFLLKLSAAF